MKFGLCMLTSASGLGCQVHTQPTWKMKLPISFVSLWNQGEKLPIGSTGGERVKNREIGRYSLCILHQHLDNHFDKWISHVDFYLFQSLWITRQRAEWCSSTEPSSWWMEVLAMSSNLLPCVKVPQHTRLHTHKHTQTSTSTQNKSVFAHTSKSEVNYHW